MPFSSRPRSANLTWCPRPLFDEPFVLLLPADHPLADKSAIAAADLDPAEVLLLGEGDRFRDQVLTAFPSLSPLQASGAVAKCNSIRGSTLEALRHMVASKLGLTILPQTAADAPVYAPDLLVTRPFESPSPKRTLILAWRVSFPDIRPSMFCAVLFRPAARPSGTIIRLEVRTSPGVLVENRNW